MRKIQGVHKVSLHLQPYCLIEYSISYNGTLWTPCTVHSNRFYKSKNMRNIFHSTKQRLQRENERCI